MMENYGIYSSGRILTSKTGAPLTNFAVRKPVAFYTSANYQTPAMLRIQVHHLEQNFTIDLDLQKQQLLQQLQEQLPTCRILKAGAHMSIEAYLLELCPRTILDQPPLYFQENGFHQLTDGSYVFVAGNEVLGLPQNRQSAISREVAQARLAYDQELSTDIAVRGFWTALERDGDIVLPLWGFTLISSMRSLLDDIDVTTFPPCAVIGRQNSGKTTVCRRFALLYDNITTGHRWGELDARSTPASTIEYIQRFRDQVVLVDDGAKSYSPVEARKRKDLLAEILRFASNNSDRSKMGVSQELVDRFCTAGLAFTSEFSMENSSDITRMLTIPIHHAMENGAPHDRTFAATVFRYFVLWLLPQVNRALTDLAENTSAINGTHQRLQKNRLLILWVLKYFFDFVLENSSVSEETISAMRQRAVRVCDSIFDQQMKLVEHLEHPKSIGWYILDGLQREIIQPVSRKKLSKRKKIPRYYCIRDKSEEDMTDFITTDALFQFLHEYSPHRFSTVNAMNRQLLSEGIIQQGQDGKSTTARIEGKRYLRIQRFDLLEAASRPPF